MINFNKGISAPIAITIIIVLAVLVSGGILAYQYYYLPNQESETLEISKEGEIGEMSQTGTIEGSLSYPSDFIPSGMKVCAESINTKEEYCTEEHIKDSKYTYGEGYKIEAPVGIYYVYATLPNWKDYRAYYSELVTCGIKVDCLSHDPIQVTVKTGEITNNIDPQDWYK